MRNIVTGFALTAIAFFGLGWFAHRPAAPPVAVQVAQAAVDTAIQRSARAETVYIHDTRTFTKIRAHYDTLRATVNIHDTVAVQQFVTLADSTIQTCGIALSSCGATVTAQDSVIATQRRLITAALADHPSRFRNLVNDAKWGVVGFAVGRLAPRVSLPLVHFTF